MRGSANLPLTTLILLTACGSSVQTVSWYEAHYPERSVELAKCENNPGQLGADPNCINAREAERRYQGSPEYKMLLQVSEAEVLATPLKKSVQDYYSREKKWPADNLSASVLEDMRGLYVDQLAISNGAIRATFGDKAAEALRSKVLVFKPSAEGNSIKWKCEGLDPKYLEHCE